MAPKTHPNLIGLFNGHIKFKLYGKEREPVQHIPCQYEIVHRRKQSIYGRTRLEHKNYVPPFEQNIFERKLEKRVKT